ncbi:MAG TPA: squalene synthase HpnC [Blastocatellia bacterium]|nr:squalene synthase HpnC [Blastocatellia bacterium]
MSASPVIIETLSSNTSLSVKEAYAYCEKLTRSHYENFPVGSVLVPKSKRHHVYGIYSFARTADDFADEGYDTPLSQNERLAALDNWQRQLEGCYRGKAEHPIFIALAETVKDLELPIKLFSDLLSAFKQDVVKRRYANFDEVLDYCTRSANPVGRLILLLFGYRDEKLHELSDHICTALQLANFWQDVAVDLDKDRIYLPQDESARFGCSEEQLFARRFDERYKELLKFQVERTREIFMRGKALPRLVSGRLSFELSLTWHGGMRILELIEREGYNTLKQRPVITKWDKAVLLARSLKR